MKNLGRIDEQETETRNTALDHLNKVPDLIGSTRHREPQAFPVDAAVLALTEGQNSLDPAVKATEEPSPEESDESTDKNKVEPESSRDSNQLLRTAVSGVERVISPKDHQYGPSSNESTEAPHPETLNPVDQFVKRGVSVDGDLQALGQHEPVKVTKPRVRYPRSICDDCYRLKRRVSVLTGWGVRILWLMLV